MRHRSPNAAATLVLLAAALLAGTGSLLAQESAPEEKELGWAGSVELSLVAVSGNAEAETLGFRATAERTWEEALLKIEAVAIRAETTERTFHAVGPAPDEVDVFEEEETSLTAENYALRGQYDRELGQRLFAFGGAGWERNEPSGIANRFFVVAGLGHVWADTETYANRTRYGLAWNREEETSGREQDFLSLRLNWDYLRQLTATTTFTNVLILDENLDETSDYRGDLTSALAVTMTERLALKVSLQLLYDNEPAFEAVPREFPAGVPAGDTVLVQLDELDTIFSAALVVKL